MILTLEGEPTQVIEPGLRYLVPTIEGLPVVVPAHVDEANEGPTSRHYHVDRRFKTVMLRSTKCDPDWFSRVAAPQLHGFPEEINVPTLKDDGREWEYAEHMAVKMRDMSGEVFGSMVWLYMKLGTAPARDGMCPHHGTELSYDDGCMVCPAHGMRFNPDGSPRFKAPYWIGAGEERTPVSLSPSFNRWGGDILTLEDDKGEVIASMFMHMPKYEVGCTLMVNIKAWEKSQGAPCTLLPVGAAEPEQLTMTMRIEYGNLV